MRAQIAVERQLKCKAKLVSGRTVTDRYEGDEVARYVETFDLDGHLTAHRAYAWAKGDGTNPNPEYHVMLHEGGIRSDDDAVRWIRKEAMRQL